MERNGFISKILVSLTMSKLEKIAKFLEDLKVLHKSGEAEFDVFCNKCGSKNCRIVFFPPFWDVQSSPSCGREISEEEKMEYRKNAIGLKCLDCGLAGSAKYDVEECTYG